MTVAAHIGDSLPVAGHVTSSRFVDSPTGGAPANSEQDLLVAPFTAIKGHRYLVSASLSGFHFFDIWCRYTLRVGDQDVLSQVRSRKHRGSGTGSLIELPVSLHGVWTATSDRQISAAVSFAADALWHDWMAGVAFSDLSVVDLGAAAAG